MYIVVGVLSIVFQYHWLQKKSVDLTPAMGCHVTYAHSCKIYACHESWYKNAVLEYIRH